MTNQNRGSSLADILFPKVGGGSSKPNYAPLGISLTNRFEHTLIMAAPGQGKTQLIQYMIARDLEEDCCVIVFDNQGQMIPKLAALGYDMQLISPHYPLAINLFDMPRDDHTSSLLRYVLSSLMDAPLTPKQRSVFDVTTSAVLNMNGNIEDFLSILEGEPFPMEGLDPLTQRFFETQWNTKGAGGFINSRQEVAWRMWGLLTNPYMKEMFSAKENRVTLETDRKLILVDCDIDKLKDYSGLFGRFFFAQLLQLAYNRFKGEHRPIYVYVDECYYYLDNSTEQMLDTARKAKIGLHFAMHRFKQARDENVVSALLGSTNTKFVGNPLVSDAPTLAKAMRTEPDFLLDQPKLHFALWQAGRNLGDASDGVYSATYTREPFEILSRHNPVSRNDCASIKVPAGYVEQMEKHPIPHDEMKQRYGRVKPPSEERVTMSTDEDDDIIPTDTL